MKRILGLDLGTNSIGWALVNRDEGKSEILGLGSRIIPMSQDILGKFNAGIQKSSAANRTGFRGFRRLRERHLLRRERLHRVLNVLGFLPEHYAKSIDFEKRLGQFIEETEPKIAYRRNETTGKMEFIFAGSFSEMVADFKLSQPQLLNDGRLIPQDWAIYYLRKKALTSKISKEELAWILLNFNQKRGYYQLRGEDEMTDEKRIEKIVELVIVDIKEEDVDRKNKNKRWYSIILENGWSYKSTFFNRPDWIGKKKEFIAKFDIDNSIPKLSILPSFEEIAAMSQNEQNRLFTKIKIKTEFEIRDSGKTVGTYIYDTLLLNPQQKIKGKLVRTIERKFYKDELEAILQKQQEFHCELKNRDLYAACLEELYKNNDDHRSSIGAKDFTHLFLNDIIFYQRPLKSKKSLISNCPYEARTFVDRETGEVKKEPIKCIAKSHPLFQEFRLWQFMQNLKIYARERVVNGKTEVDKNITQELLKTEEDWIALFRWLNDRKDVDQKAFLKYPAFGFKKDSDKYRWNYVEDKDKLYPCNETRTLIETRLAKVPNVPADFLSREVEEALWHILYSVEDKHEIKKALATFAKRHGLDTHFVEVFEKFPRFPKEYGAYSAKAIKKLLPLMRRGQYWSKESIASDTLLRINKLLTDEFDENIRNRVREKAINLTCIEDFQNLPLWLACYVVYDRHSESGDIKQWKTPADVENYLRYEFKQHSLRNPIVEQVITETLRVVKDIWEHYGRGAENYFSEIHIELGREMKNPADKRRDMTSKVTENENTNLRIKALLMEMLNDGTVADVRAYSPSQQEILKIYEEGALSAESDIPDYILNISKQAKPSAAELARYILWLDQRYQSPYTGEMIPLSRLFTPDYEIEHVIPQSRYFDNSLSNKVICEAEVNKDKGNATAYEYIKNNSGKKIELSYGKEVTLFTLSAYEDNVKRSFAKNRGKLKKLLMEDISEEFIARQMNDSRYISKVVKNLLSNMVRVDDEQEATSKNVISSNGAITSILKQDWGLNDVWNDIIAPRFERMNQHTNSTKYGTMRNNNFLPQVPLTDQRGFSKKRIDHRHHAMDALVIACATRNHINYLNNANAAKGKEKERLDLRENLCYKKRNSPDENNYRWTFKKPWDAFTQDTREVLLSTVVSFKQNLRVINKTVNYYQHWQPDEHGNMQKKMVQQTKGDSWAIRKPMHVPMPYGKKTYEFDVLQISKNVGKYKFIINKEIRDRVELILLENGNKISAAEKFIKENPLMDNKQNLILTTEFEVNTEKYRKRQPISKLSNRGNGGIKSLQDMLKLIDKVADFKLRADLLLHLKDNNNDIDLAFNADGIDNFNKKRNTPIFRLPIAEKGEKRFALGSGQNTRHKWMEAENGTNLFFAVYNSIDKREFDTIPLNDVVERMKQYASEKVKFKDAKPVPEINKKGNSLLFWLSPDDLVYVPTDEECNNQHLVDFEKLTKEQSNRIYKFVSCTEGEGHFVPHYYASPIKIDEIGANNKSQNTIDASQAQIKAVCWKLKVDRLGRIVDAIKR